MIRLLDNVSKYRYLLANFITRDLKLKYRGSVAGYLWTLLEPMALVATYYFVFVVIAERGDRTYPIVVLLGVLPYNLFSAIVTGGANALVANAPLIRRIYIPRELFLVAQIGSSAVVFFLSLLVVIPFLIFYGIVPGPTLLLLPVAVVAIILFSTGIGLAVSCLNVLYRDVSYVLSVLLRIAFYGSPVIYSIDMVPERLRELYFANPLAVYLSLVRSAVLHQPLAVPTPQLSFALLAALGSFFGGAALFSRWERQVVKHL